MNFPNASQEICNRLHKNISRHRVYNRFCDTQTTLPIQKQPKNSPRLTQDVWTLEAAALSKLKLRTLLMLSVTRVST